MTSSLFQLRVGRIVSAVVLALAMARPTPGYAQEVISKEAAAVVKASFIADIETLRGKFIGLAEAFPQDKYNWKPMDGVRSVSEVLMLAAMEGYTFVPSAVGGKPAALGTREEMAKISATTDKAQILDHLNKGFAHAIEQLTAADPATLTGRRRLMGRELSFPDGVLAISGDLHEHLGQLIAYARTNHVVPPWSK